MTTCVASLIGELSLEAHPEGGYYRRTFESDYKIQTANGERPAVTCIYYLLGRGEYSKWHRLKSTERWFYHRGSGIKIHTLVERKGIETHLLGPHENTFVPIVDVPPDTWFCAEIAEGGDYALVSCMVSPGFDFRDFEIADASVLEEMCSDQAELIRKFS